MTLSRLSFSLILACAAMSAQAASFDCVAPVFPEVSTTNEGIRRVEKQVNAWRTCHAAYRAQHDSVDIARLDDEVNAGLEKWIMSVRAHSQRQGMSNMTLTRLERDQAAHLPVRSDAPRTTFAAGRR